MGLMDNRFIEDRTWGLVALASGALAAMAINKAMESGWQLVQDEEPPENPAARKVTWKAALAWTVATSVATGVGQLVARRGAAAGWRRIRGHYPAGLD